MKHCAKGFLLCELMVGLIILMLGITMGAQFLHYTYRQQYRVQRQYEAVSLLMDSIALSGSDLKNPETMDIAITTEKYLSADGLFEHCEMTASWDEGAHAITMVSGRPYCQELYENAEQGKLLN